MNLNFAVLIDADNIPSDYIKEMLEEVAKYGTPTIKRIYGDWTKPNLNKWKKILLKNAVTPIQQYCYTTGKNATDSAMIIDAMDILYSEKVNGFCLVSSDSDFTRLAVRLREAGMKVLGIGEKKTPEPFIYLEILKNQVHGDDSKSAKNKDKTKESVDVITPEVIKLISSTITDLADDDGWAFLGDVGSFLLKKKTNFDSRNYGFPKLTPLIESIKKFEVEKRKSPNGKSKIIYIRIKPKLSKNAE